VALGALAVGAGVALTLARRSRTGEQAVAAATRSAPEPGARPEGTSTPPAAPAPLAGAPPASAPRGDSPPAADTGRARRGAPRVAGRAPPRGSADAGARAPEPPRPAERAPPAAAEPQPEAAAPRSAAAEPPPGADPPSPAAGPPPAPDPSPPSSPPPPSATTFVAQRVVAFRQLFGDPAARDSGRRLVDAARLTIAPSGEVTFAPAQQMGEIFPVTVPGTRAGDRVTFEGVRTARARDGQAYVRISGIATLEGEPAVNLDLEIGRAGAAAGDLEPTYRARARMLLAPE
jgi:hypothetical protein